MHSSIATRSGTLLAATALLALASAAGADTIFATAAPANTPPFGYRGYDLYPSQAIAARFIPTGAYTLGRVSIWFMSNDTAGTTPQTVTVSLRTDVNPGTAFTSAPSDTILETWTMDVPVVGYNPALIAFNSASHPALAAGQRYWVVAESSVPAGVDPLWVWSGQGNEFIAESDGAGTPWESRTTAAIGLVVEGTPVTAPACPADVGIAGGGPGSDGMLDNNDFIAFINYFFDHSPVADVGVAGGLPGHDSAWDNNDFIAFINHFFDGCDA